jgi:DNA-directed RNA polymerase subunit RPC12/RpoP
MEYKCPECGEPLIDFLEEVVVVTVLRTSRIIGIEYEAEDGEVLFDYEGMPNEDDQDVDSPVYYQCGYCGHEINKATVVEVLKNGS